MFEQAAKTALAGKNSLTSGDKPDNPALQGRARLG